MRILCENELEEVWHQARRYGTPEYCDYQMGDDAPSDSEFLKQYVVTRVLQALEFREPTRNATVLSRPLLVYYSLLNLTRAMLAVATHKPSEPSHGLAVSGDHSSLGELYAKVRKTGTLVELLQVRGISTSQDQVHFHSLLESIPELRSALNVPGRRSDVSVVWVRATIKGGLRFHFPQQSISAEDFEASWRENYPGLVSSFEHGDAYTLSLKDGELPLDDDPNLLAQRIGKFCDEKLEANLIDPSRWYLVSAQNPHAIWPREARYLAALFILSHTVRYQPELLYRESIANSYQHTLVDSVVRMADRYVPQLLLGSTGTPHFFCG